MANWVQIAGPNHQKALWASEFFHICVLLYIRKATAKLQRDWRWFAIASIHYGGADWVGHKWGLRDGTMVIQSGLPKTAEIYLVTEVVAS